MDLNGLSPGNKEKLLYESRDHLFPIKDLQNFPPLEVISDSLLFKREMAWVVKPPPERHSEEYWSLILDLQKVVWKELWDLTDVYKVSGIPATEFIPHGTTWSNTVIFHSHVDPDKFFFSWIPGKSQEDYLRVKLNLLLSGLPRSTLTRCPAPIGRKQLRGLLNDLDSKQCNKYFLNFSRRKKTFCSLQCLWRFNTMRRREADPEAYKEYQKVLMRDRRRDKARWEPLRKSRKIKKGVTGPAR